MPDIDDAFSTLDDFLLSLAEGVSLAQTELARSNSNSDAQFTYHMPRVDFELKMNLRVVEDTGLSRRYAKLQTTRTSNKHLLFRPLAADESRSTLEIAAVVRGAFVSVPKNGGLPSTILETRLDTAQSATPAVIVRATNTAGEPVVGLPVEFNVDREESAALSTNQGLNFSISNGTRFSRGVVTTDETGQARAVLELGANQPRVVLALSIDAAGQTETLVYEVRA